MSINLTARPVLDDKQSLQLSVQPVRGCETPDSVDAHRSGVWTTVAGPLAWLWRRPVLTISLLFLSIVTIAAVAPHLIAPGDPFHTVPLDKLQPPSWAHWMGTDQLGRDLYTRVIHGSRLTIEAAVLAIALAIVGGLVIGVLSGFVGGLLDSVAMRFIDVLLAIPGLLLALAIVTALGFGTVPVAIAIGVGTIPGFARTTRAEVLRVKTLPYVEAARTGGASWFRVLLTHVLPNSWGPVAVLAVLDVGQAIMAVAALSFLGFGAAPPAAEWGTLIADGRNYLITSPWVSMLPGLFVSCVVLSINNVARAIEEIER
jgi:peptide/nickel transport system permease protein